jgi:hypothetical protein
LIVAINPCCALFTSLSSALGYLNDKGEAPSQLEIAGVQATGGVIAGAVTSCVTTPIDTIKTRLQVLFPNWIYATYFCRKNRLRIIVGCIVLCLSAGIYRVQES